MLDDAASFWRGRGEHTVYHLCCLSRKGLRGLLGAYLDKN